jgi:Fuc2NAc and GlcNAc transferase
MREFALKRRLLDVPNARSSHKSPTPRGGGVAIIAAFFISTVALAIFQRLDSNFVIALWVGGGLVALIGFIDDRKSQPAILRFAVHIVAATIVVILLMKGYLRAGAAELWVGGFLAIAALTWVANLFNFMDGIDGIAASEAAFIMAAAAMLHWYFGGDLGITCAMLNLAAAALGFLLWNWPPAKIFMGDVGSGFLGFVIGSFAIYTSLVGSVPLSVWVILSAAFVTDATATLILRILRGDRWTEAHRMHAYQHLAIRWKSHSAVTLTITIINLLWLFPCALLELQVPRLEPLWLSLAVLPLLGAALISGAGRPSG